MNKMRYAMKRIINVLFVGILTVLFLAGCSSRTEPSMDVNRLDTKLSLEQNLDTFPQYADEENLLLSLEKSIKVNVGPGSETKGFFKYNLKNDTLEQVVPMDLNAQTHSAVPFGNAILYVDYVMKNGPLEWTVVHFENGTKQNLRSGICSYYEDLPKLSILEGRPVLLWKDSKKSEFGLEIFDGEKLSEIELPKGQNLVSTDSACNTKEICFLTENDAGDARFLIVGKNGEIESVTLDGKITSFGLTKDALVCGLGDYEQTGKFSLMVYNFRSKEKKNTAVNKPLYRMTDSKTDVTLCVDSTFQLLKIDSINGDVHAVQISSEYSRKPVVLRTVCEEGCIAAFIKDEQDTQYEYYRLSWN